MSAKSDVKGNFWLSSMPLVNRLFGWQDIEPSSFPTEPVMFVISHSSYWDIFLLLIFSYTPQFKNLYSIGKPQFRNWYYWPLRTMVKFMYASRLEDRGSGTTRALLNEFESIPPSSVPKYVVLSPKGTTSNKPWRSGYYYFAKEARLKIHPLIIDYSSRTVVIGDPVNPAVTSLLDATTELQTKLGSVRVINMENAEYPIRDHCGCPYESMFPFDMCCVSLLTFLPYWVGLLYQGFYSQATLTFACISVAWKYHMDYEGTYSRYTALYQQAEANLAITTMTHHIAYTIWMKGSLPPIFILSTVFGGFYYINSIPRGSMPKRGKYVVYHSVYHVLAAIAAFSLL